MNYGWILARSVVSSECNWAMDLPNEANKKIVADHGLDFVPPRAHCHSTPHVTT
jgi:hypothetical protein